MCGISGILAFDDRLELDEPIIERMTNALTHRGPDDGGTWVRGEHGIALGHRRLSIIDLSAAGHQPMSNEDGTVWITYNGEVYNHAKLRPELERAGHVYRSHTDTETIIHLWEEEGPRCVEDLRGMFAFAIWDERRRELFIARDRLGVKPLYYAHTEDGSLYFASEIKALLEAGAVRAELNYAAPPPPPPPPPPPGGGGAPPGGGPPPPPPPPFGGGGGGERGHPCGGPP